MWQESQRIIRGKQGKTDQVSKNDQHKEVIQISSFFLCGEDHLM